MHMDWEKFVDALEESAEGAERQAAVTKDRLAKQRIYLVSDLTHVLLNAVKKGLGL